MAQKSPHLHSATNNDSGARSTVDSHELLAWNPQGTGHRISLAGHPSRYSINPVKQGCTQVKVLYKHFSFKKEHQPWKMNHTWKRPTSSERAIANSNFFSSNMSSWLGKLLLASSLYIALCRRPASDDLSIIVCGVGAAGTTAAKYSVSRSTTWPTIRQTTAKVPKIKRS